MRKLVLGIVSAAILSVGAHAQTGNFGPEGVLDRDLRTFLDWFAGRYDNDLQLLFADDIGTPEDHRHERIHSIFFPVELPAFGEHVFYVQQYLNNDPDQVYRQRIYVFSPDYEANAIRLDIFAPNDPDALMDAHLHPERLDGLTPDMTRSYPGCEVYWRRQENQFIGETVRGACRVESQRSGRTLVIEDDLVLTDSAIWIHDRAETADGEYVYGNRGGIPHKLNKIRTFQCWAAILRGAEHGDRGQDQDDWWFTRGVFLHDQGGTAVLTTDETQPRSFELRMRHPVWPYGNSRASTTLYIHEAGNDRALSYAWGEYDAERLGINLRWLQASCTHTPGLWGDESE